MIIMQGRSAHEQYRNSLDRIMQQGAGVEVRGLQTKELLDVATVIAEPWHHCHFVPGRRWNPWIAMSEALWILAGRDDLAPLLPYNKRMAEFSDDGKYLYGAYGLRIAEQIPTLIERLEKDPNDRRAVLAIWNQRDLIADTADPPCNTQIMFKLRDNKLHMTVLNRSNDLHWGLYGVNLPTFGILQDWLAARLGVQMGTQTHLSNSLHIYTGGRGMKENWAITERMMARSFEALPEMPIHERAFTAQVQLDTLVEACNIALDIEDKLQAPQIPFLEFADDFLQMHRESGKALWKWDDLRHHDKYWDWCMAARIWKEEGEDRFR